MRRSRHSFSAPGKFTSAAWRQSKHITICKIQPILKRHEAPVAAVYFWPEAPHPYTVVYRALHALGVSVKRGLPESSPAPTFYWEDSTLGTCKAASDLVNWKCTDISKSTLDAARADIFGYSLNVDPLKHQAEMVQKSEANGEHDGLIIKAPLSRRKPGYVYQAVIDNRELTDANLVLDYRVVVLDSTVKFIFAKCRPLSDRFSNKNSRTVVRDNADQLFEERELTQMEELASRLGLGAGELDVLRDQRSGMIYVIDASKTPLGPPNGLSKADWHQAFHLYKLHCRRFLEGWSAKHQKSRLAPQDA